MQPVDNRLAQTAAEGPANKPLQLHGACLAHGHQPRHARVRLIGANPRALELGRLEKAPVA